MFGRDNERRRQWSLLGGLLKSLAIVEALDFMDRAFESKTVPWAQFREQAAAGRTLHDIARDPGLKTPDEVLEALEHGAEDGRLPERLTALETEPSDALTLAEADDGIVTMANAMLLVAAEEGATGLMLQRLEGGDGQVKIYQGDAWTLHSRHPAEEYAALVRRFLILCAQPYWAPKKGLFRMRMRQGPMEVRVTPDGRGGLGIEIVPPIPEPAPEPTSPSHQG